MMLWKKYSTWNYLREDFIQRGSFCTSTERVSNLLKQEGNGVIKKKKKKTHS